MWRSCKDVDEEKTLVQLEQKWKSFGNIKIEAGTPTWLKPCQLLKKAEGVLVIVNYQLNKNIVY